MKNLVACFVAHSSGFLTPLVLHPSGSYRVRNQLTQQRTAAAAGSDLLMVDDNPELLRKQARALRDEAQSLRQDLEDTIQAKKTKQLADVDRWIEELLVNRTVNEQSQILNTVDQTAQLMKDKRYSPEQINKMFERLCETCSVRGRDSVESNPLLGLLVEAAGKLDSLERDQNPNKRWNGHVERDLRKKLFAIEWGIDLEKPKDD